MEGLQKYSSWRPSHEQELLLQATLQSGRPSVEALEKWSATANIYALDDGSRRLLPLLYQNLKYQGISHPISTHAKKIYMETWAKNQVLYAKIIPVLQLLESAQIRTIILKGAAFTVRYYRDYGVRPMTDFDILVPTSQAEKAISYLQQSGWEPEVKSPEKYVRVYLRIHHALHFSDSLNNYFDLHWHLLNECLAPDADEDYWNGSVPIDIKGAQSHCLNATDDLFHVCLHGVGWNRMPPIRWIADAVKILDSGELIYWDRMVGLAERRQMTLTLKDALTYLKENFNAPIPADCIEQLERVSVTSAEVKEYKTRTNHPFWSFYAPTLWAFYPRIARDTGLPAGLFGFIKYLQLVRELDHIWQLPLSLIWSAMRRVIGKP